jgi:hypothetical protein
LHAQRWSIAYRTIAFMVSIESGVAGRRFQSEPVRPPTRNKQHRRSGACGNAVWVMMGVLLMGCGTMPRPTTRSPARHPVGAAQASSDPRFTTTPMLDAAAKSNGICAARRRKKRSRERMTWVWLLSVCSVSGTEILKPPSTRSTTHVADISVGRMSIGEA